MDATGFHVAGLRTPMRFGGTSVPEMVVEKQASIFRPVDMDGTPRVNLPAENPKYPETKHTLKCVKIPRCHRLKPLAHVLLNSLPLRHVRAFYG